ncbi:hypothetical protein [Azospirillum sp. TSO5]|uniref:hypothetical protein n=1 Tax=Azospirillum sp. TSO5 TaxID=716760 RepID=UPI000D618E3E|nr:hypothetical protein [Azospirillum sp. TSO5]PWC98054.1 hypothetical protein TSO5_03370 [Azospirillum sp. TSO5]
MTAINQQTQGPIAVVRSDGSRELIGANIGETEGKNDGIFIAHTLGPDRQPNARLLAAAYNAFDGAGRKLGVDAAEMAERLGPEGLAEVAALAISIRKLVGTDDKRGLAQMKEGADRILLLLTGE